MELLEAAAAVVAEVLEDINATMVGRLTEADQRLLAPARVA